MQTTLLNFTKQNLFDASRAFFAKIGVKCTDQSCLPINFLSVYEESVKKIGLSVPQTLADVFSKIETTHLIGAVTEDSLAGKVDAMSLEEVEAAEQYYKGMLLMSVKVKNGVTLTRTEMTQITRGANRIAIHNPVTVLILQSGYLSIATCERTQFVQTWRPGERLGKVSILKNVNCLNPHHGHINILKSMDVKGCKTYDELYACWKDVFSINLLTKQFYREIQNWYFWALKKEQHVAFPNALDDNSDDEKYNSENVIRLITRLIFTWFMKEKGLVNKALFDTDFLSRALHHFNSEGHISDSKDSDSALSCTYYRAILQNLFFATFNQEVGLRDFVNSQVRDAKRYNIKNYYRNEKLFTETDRAKIIGYFNGSPFVNGGLFECLDNVEQNGRVYSWDGFSNSVHFKDGSLKSALIPDRLFFGGETTTDLSEFFEKDKSCKSVKVRGIINILNDYVFTIEENTPFDEDVALDPELLGKVFENLLGCYNPETQQMARNATGSFYTPREIVNYMVKVTLKSYLRRACPKVAHTEIDALVDGVAELAEMPSVKECAKDILTALFKAKILDPACGSGAFPMGIMSAMVEILRTIDPDNRHWYEIVLKESLNEAESIADVGDERERAELRTQIEYDFKERMDHPDYARKLYTIEHCIFGSDIQPIAVQISRLRFFITLLCEQTKNDDPAKNYGITPLPNLESNFVAANSLLSIDLKDMRELLGQKKIVSLVKQLRGIRHQLFQPKTSDKKKRLQRKDEELRTAIATAAEGLYDENVLEKSKILESELRRCDQSLEKLTEDDFRDVLRQIEDVNLFGEKSVSIKKVVGRGKELKKRRDMIAAEIASLKNASRKERLLTDLKRLVAWNPFAFNVVETFLDPEWMFGVKDGFDIVIGNPPYVVVSGTDPLKDYYDTNYVTARGGKKNLFRLFFERGILLLKQKGCLSFITPNTFLSGKAGAALRNFFFNQVTLLQLLEYSERDRVFENVTQAVVVSVMTREVATSDHMVKMKTERQGELLASQSKMAATDSLIPQNSIVEKFFAQPKFICDYIKGFQGEVNVSMQRDSYSKTHSPDTLPMWRGEYVGRFINCGVPDEYCRISAPKRTHYKFPRIITQEVSNQSGNNRIKCCIIPKGQICGHSTNYITAESEDVKKLYFWLGLMNSRLFDYVFNYANPTNHIPIGKLMKMAVPQLTEHSQVPIIALVAEILKAKKADLSADTSILESEIDEKVFDLYGLTTQERKMVLECSKQGDCDAIRVH